MRLSERAQLALDTILQKPVRGIPSWMLFIMEHSIIERLAGAQPGDYKKHPHETYLTMQKAIHTCLIDQYIPLNPLTMGDMGFESEGWGGASAHESPESAAGSQSEGSRRGATTGASEIMLDGIVIDSPEAVVRHMESFVFPSVRAAIKSFDEDARVKEIIESESALQETLGPDILKSGHGFVHIPTLDYCTYGYVNYFTACGLYEEVIEKQFSLQADLALLNNRAAARAYEEGNLPPLFRLDHDIADSRGTLIRIGTLDKLWLPHLARCLEPLLKTAVRLIWHCDGNLMELVPRLLDIGLRGFQGFQYEDGMDYEKICRMKTRDGDDLLILAGVSVTRTLPRGTPADVRKELQWLVENGPKTGLFLGASSSITPGVPWENIETLVEGLEYYRTHGRV